MSNGSCSRHKQRRDLGAEFHRVKVCGCAWPSGTQILLGTASQNENARTKFRLIYPSRMEAAHRLPLTFPHPFLAQRMNVRELRLMLPCGTDHFMPCISLPLVLFVAFDRSGTQSIRPVHPELGKHDEQIRRSVLQTAVMALFPLHLQTQVKLLKEKQN